MMAAVAALALTACGRRNGRTGQGPYADKVAEAVPQIEAAVGVRFKSPPRLEVRSKEQVRDFLLKKFDETTPSAEVAGQEAAYKAFGLIPDTLNLRKFLVDLLTEQIVGYYDPTTKVLYVVQGAPDDLVGVTITHELVHALQDQYLNLDSLQRQTGNSDRATAAQAVIEGQATYEQMSIMLGGGDIAQHMIGGWDKVRQTIRESQGSMPIFSSAPIVIQEELLFPYLSGAEFIRRFKQHEPGKQPWLDMPVSTAQVLHEDQFFGAQRQVPVSLTLPSTTGRTVYENVLGEFDTRLLIYQFSQDQNLAYRGAEGWIGDRYRIVSTPAGNAVVWATAWKSQFEAAEFVEAMGQGVTRMYHTGSAALGAGGVRTYTGARHTVQITPVQVGATSVVLYEDVPQGQSPRLLEPSRITVAPAT